MILDILYVWLCVGLLHFIIFTTKNRDIFNNFGLIAMCLVVGPPFFVYEIYQKIRRK